MPEVLFYFRFIAPFKFCLLHSVCPALFYVLAFMYAFYLCKLFMF